MNKDSIIREQNEETVRNRADKILGIQEDFIDTTLLYAAVNDEGMLSKCYLLFLTEYFTFYNDKWDDNQKEEIIEYCVYLCDEGQIDFSKVPIHDIRLFYEYCFIIRQSMFYSLGQSCNVGISYNELIEKILSDLNLHDISKKGKNRLCNNFTTYIQNRINGSGNFQIATLPTWNSSIGIKEKNSGRGSIGTILWRERASYEFEFYIRPKNKSSDEESRMVTERLEDEAKKRLIPIFKELRFDEIIQEWNDFRKEYSKLAQKPLRDMEDDELRLYLKFMDCKRLYVRYYSIGCPDDGALAERWLSHELAYSLMEYFYSTNLIEQDFSIAGGVLSEINNRLVKIAPSDVERRTGILPEDTLPITIFWNGMVQLLNSMDAIVNSLNQKGLGLARSYCEGLADEEKFRQFRKLCEDETVIQPNQSKRIIKEQFIDRLWNANIGWQDLIEICYLANYCISWAEYRDKQVISYKMLNEGELYRFGRAYSYIIEALKSCKEKAQDQWSQGNKKVNISNEIKSLKSNLASLQIELETENFTPTYYDGDIKKKDRIQSDGAIKYKKKSVRYSDYFEKCYETAPTRLYILLEDEFKSGTALNVEKFLQKYMETILNRRKGEELLVPSKYDKLLSNLLYTRLTCSLHPSFRVQSNISNFFKKQNRLLDLCRKYDIEKTFWHPDDDPDSNYKAYSG